MSGLIDYVIFASYGNDSVALIRWMHERGYGSTVHVVYSDTGWSADFWPARVEKGETWAQSLRFQTHRTVSEGMEGLVRRKKAWPRGGGGKYQFCTEALKERPALEWLDKVDRLKDAVCVVGIRREESENRRSFPEWTESSEKHGGRRLWAPLVNHSEEQRNELIARTPMPVLPYRSKECYPCVNMNNRELKHLTPEAQKRVFWLENDMGTNSRGNERVMFSPARHGDAVGINAVVAYAQKNNDDMFPVSPCDAGWCGE